MSKIVFSYQLHNKIYTPNCSVYSFNNLTIIPLELEDYITFLRGKWAVCQPSQFQSLARTLPQINIKYFADVNL